MDDERPPDKPTTFKDLLWYTKRYEAGIYFRVKRDGEWGAVSLDKLDAKEWAERMDEILGDGIIPCRVREDNELNDESEVGE